MPDPVCPQTGTPMHRGVRSLTLTYKGESITMEMPAQPMVPPISTNRHDAEGAVKPYIMASKVMEPRMHADERRCDRCDGRVGAFARKHRRPSVFICGVNFSPSRYWCGLQ